MKKNNKKGFTLIELVIVATIMVMIMGAILNWVRPMNKFYQRTQSLSDTNDIGSMLLDNVDDELRYATNIVVLKDYQGVPKLTGNFLIDSSGNASYFAKFTNVLILDNDTNVVRGSRFADYVENLTVSRRKRAYGCIIKANITSDGIDTDNMKCLGSEPLYNDYACQFNATLNNLENGSSCVNIDMELTRPRRDGASYVFDQYAFSQNRDFELVNVNLKTDDTMIAEMYSASGEEGKTLDYNTFTKASNSGSNPNADQMYTGSSSFTYILYTKEPVKAEEVTVNVYDAPGSTTVYRSLKLTAGNSIKDEIIDAWIADAKNNFTSAWIPSGSGYERTEFDSIRDGNGQDIETYRNKGILKDVSFYVTTNPATRDEPVAELKFLDRYDDGRVDKGSNIYPKFNAGIWEDDHYVSGVPDGNGDDKGEYTFVGWYLDTYYPPAPGVKPDPDNPSGSVAAGWFVNGQEYFTGATYYAVYEKKPTVTFHFEAADDSKLTAPFPVADISVRIDDEYSITTFLSETRYIDITNTFESLLNEGLSFTGWTVVGSDGTDYGSLSGLDLSTLTPDETYTIIGDADSNPYPGSFLVTITIEAVPEGWHQLQIGGYNADPNNSYYMSDILIVNGEGSTIVPRSSTNGVPYPFVAGETVKMYVFSSKANIGYGNDWKIFDSESKWKFNGSQFVQIG